MANMNYDIPKPIIYELWCARGVTHHQSGVRLRACLRFCRSPSPCKRILFDAIGQKNDLFLMIFNKTIIHNVLNMRIKAQYIKLWTT